jgi:hypothetical protein
MPMASSRDPAAATYQTYFATRAGPGATFGTPRPVSEIDAATRLTVDGFLTDDGLTLFYSSASEAARPAHEPSAGDPGRALDAGTRFDAGAPADAGTAFGSSDLFVAWRRSTDDPFDSVQTLTDLNTSADERDPWLSPDGSMFFFTSDRDGVPNIYSVSVRPR